MFMTGREARCGPKTWVPSPPALAKSSARVGRQEHAADGGEATLGHALRFHAEVIEVGVDDGADAEDLAVGCGRSLARRRQRIGGVA